MNIELITRLHTQTEIVDGHWLWVGATTGRGYGSVRYNESYWSVHRLSLCLFLKLKYNGVWVACHICEHKNCWNPLHLYKGTYKDNAIDHLNTGKSFWKNKESCPKGHEYTPENTYLTPQGWRECRACRGISMRAYRARQNA